MLQKVPKVAKPEWGTKRTCDKCGDRFYDLNRDPAVCPQCGTERLDKPPAKTSAKATAPAKAPPPEAPSPEPKVVDELAQVVDAFVADDSVGDEEENDDIDAADKDGELIEDASDLIEDTDDVAEVVNTMDDADATKE